MVKKKYEVAYIPISENSEITNQIESVSNQEIANYSDVGIDYKGYARIKISNNKYKLVTQRDFLSSGSYGWVASATDTSVYYAANLDNRRVFIKSMVISYYTDVACFFLLRESDTKREILRFIAEPDNHTQIINIVFSAPFELKQGNLYVQPSQLGTVSTGINITGRVMISLSGWFEDKG